MRKTKKEDKAAVAEQRSNIYGLLAAAYREEITSDLLRQIKDPRFLGVLSGLGIDMTGDFFQKPEEEVLEDMSVEYARIFIGPGKHISPHESVHHKKDNAKWGQLWGDSTVEVKNFIETSGLEYKPEYKGLPDHISVELEFMQQLTLREAQAWNEDDEEGAMSCLNIEKQFIEKHIIQWIPVFCEKVVQEAELPFYRAMAALTESYIKYEKQHINNGDHV